MTPPSSWDDPQQRPPSPPPRGAPSPPPAGQPGYQQYSPPQHQPPAAHHPQQGPHGQRRFSAKQILAAVLAVLALVFILENTQTTTVRLIGPRVHVPLFVALFIAAALGAAVTFLLMWRRHRGRTTNTPSA